MAINTAAIIDTEHVEQSAHCSINLRSESDRFTVRVRLLGQEETGSSCKFTVRCNFKHEEVDVVRSRGKSNMTRAYHSFSICLSEVVFLMHTIPRRSLMRRAYRRAATLTFREFMEMCYTLTLSNRRPTSSYKTDADLPRSRRRRRRLFKGGHY